MTSAEMVDSILSLSWRLVQNAAPVPAPMPEPAPVPEAHEEEEERTGHWEDCCGNRFDDETELWDDVVDQVYESSSYYDDFMDYVNDHYSVSDAIYHIQRGDGESWADGCEMDFSEAIKGDLDAIIEGEDYENSYTGEVYTWVWDEEEEEEEE